MTISQVGPYPPPYGGVGTHMERLRLRLLLLGCRVPVWWRGPSGANDPDVTVMPALSFPWGYFGWALDCWRKLPGALVHFHRTSTYPVWAWCSALRLQKVVITVHDQFSLETRRLFEGIGRWGIRQLAVHPNCRFIAVNQKIRCQLLALGVPEVHITVLPAFLPPLSSPRLEDLPLEIRAFARKHRPLLSLYGIYCGRVDPWGDLYGYDVALESLKLVQEKHPDAGLVVLTPNNQNKPYFQELLARARRLGVERDVLWWTKTIPDGSPLWKLSDVYLRPTGSDGDALAVREALCAGTPVVASDVTERPQGCIVYRWKDLEGLLQGILNAIEQGQRTPQADELGGFEKILRIYGELCPEMGIETMVRTLAKVVPGAANVRA